MLVLCLAFTFKNIDKMIVSYDRIPTIPKSAAISAKLL